VARKIAARVATALSEDPPEAAGAERPVDAAPAADPTHSVVTAGSLPDYLGPPRFHREVPFRVSRPGVATGVAWTETGGDVLPVGGIREKALAARRYGIKEFILPARNEPDLAELPREVRDDIKFVPVETLEDALKVALPS